MLNAVVYAAFPVFALILTGWLCARFKLLNTPSMEGLNKFVIYLALPAQLFDAMSHASVTEIMRPGFFAAYALGMLGTVLLFAWLTRRAVLPVTDQLINGMSSAYSNSGFMGIPLCLIVFGKTGMAPSIITTFMTVSVLFAVTIILIEFKRLKQGRLGPAVRKVFLSMLRNPLLIAPIAGVCWSATDWGMPAPIERYISLIGLAASPCALIAIGLFLALNPVRGIDHTVVRIVALKLLVQPALTALLVLYVFDIPMIWAYVAILCAALPVGTGPFMMAHIYQRDATASARAIMLSTLGSVLTIPALLAWISANLP